MTNTQADHRFTILLHVAGPELQRPGPDLQRHGELPVAGGPSHWDWLFDRGEKADGATHPLWTWATSPLDDDVFETGICCSALRLADHRRRYLDYEGPISGNRGSVSLVSTGVYRTLSSSGERFEAELRVGDHRWSCVFAKGDPDQPLWTLQFDRLG